MAMSWIANLAKRAFARSGDNGTARSRREAALEGEAAGATVPSPPDVESNSSAGEGGKHQQQLTAVECRESGDDSERECRGRDAPPGAGDDGKTERDATETHRETSRVGDPVEGTLPVAAVPKEVEMIHKSEKHRTSSVVLPISSTEKAMHSRPKCEGDGSAVGNDDSNGKRAHAYRPEIDGLRAIAVIGVLLFHYGLSFPGGFSGVDVFFVISGYLITLLQVRRLQLGTFTLKDFWMRRVRRLFPAMLLMVIVVLVAGNFILLGSDFEELAEESMFVLISAANFHFMSKPYFTNPWQFPLLNCWSLAVEEQYYLLFPLVISVLWRIAGGGKRSVFAIAFVLHAVFAASFAFALIMVNSTWRKAAGIAYFTLPSRAFEMAAGGVLAFYQDYGLDILRKHRWLSELCGLSSLALIIAPNFVFGESTPWPSAYTLVPCLGTMLYIWSEGARLTLGGRILSSGIPVYIGKISYSLYLWHWPIIVLVTYTLPYTHRIPLGITLLFLGVSVAVGSVSYATVEQYLRSTKHVKNVVFFPACFCIWGVTLGVCVAAFTVGFGGVRFPSMWQRPVPQVRAGNCTCPPGSGICVPYLSQGEIDDLYRIDGNDLDLGTLVNPDDNGIDRKGYYIGFSVWPDGKKSADVDIVTIGDSHCAVFYPLFEQLALESNKSLASLCKGGYGLGAFGVFPDWDKERLEYLEQFKSVDLIVVTHRYDQLLNYATHDFANDISIMLKYANRVIFLGDVPSHQEPLFSCESSLKSCVYRLHKKDNNFDFLSKMRYDYNNATLGSPTDKVKRAEDMLRSAVANQSISHGRVEFFDIYPYYVDSETSYISTVDPFSGQLIRIDEDHLNMLGQYRIEQFLRTHVFDLNSTDCTPP